MGKTARSLVISESTFLILGTMKKNGGNTVKKKLKENLKTIALRLSVVIVLLGSAWICAGSESTVSKCQFEPTCHPIVPLPSSQSNLIRQKLIDEEEFELAIRLTSHCNEGLFWAFVVKRDDSGYKCFVKRVLLEDIVRDHRVDPALVAGCNVDVESRVIDSDSVKILVDTLRQQVSKAKYQTKGPGADRLDGTDYEVFVKGAPGDPYRVYAGVVDDGGKRSSRSCSAITFALAHLVLSENDKMRADPLNRLTKYLKSLADGTAEGDDPFLNKEIPAPDFELPPP